LAKFGHNAEYNAENTFLFVLLFLPFYVYCFFVFQYALLPDLDHYHHQQHQQQHQQFRLMSNVKTHCDNTTGDSNIFTYNESSNS